MEETPSSFEKKVKFGLCYAWRYNIEAVTTQQY